MIAAAGPAIGWLAWAALLVASVIAMAFFCGMETGIYVLNKIRMDLAAESGQASARLLRRLLAKPNNLLTVLLIGTNLAGYFATFAVSSMFVRAGYGESAEWWTLLVATPVLFVLAESVPKNAFGRLAEKLVYRLAWPLAASSTVLNAVGLAPLARGFSALLGRLAGTAGRQARQSQPLLATLVAEGHASGAMTHFQSVMADRVMRIGEVKLAEAMVPMANVVKADIDVSRDELTDLIRQQRYSRLPLVSQDGKVQLILDTFDILAGSGELTPRELARPPMALTETMSVTDALYQMQRAKEVIAVIADPTGKHVGIVTIKDLVEEIVGELQEW